MKRLLLFSIFACLYQLTTAQSRTLSADRLIAYDSIYVGSPTGGRWITRKTIDSIGIGGSDGTNTGVDTMYVSSDTLYFKKQGNTYFQKLPAGTGGSSFIIGTGPDQFLANTVTSSHIGGVAFFSDGSISTYAWAQIAGTPTGTLDSSNVAFTTISGLQPGNIYQYKLTATNNLGATKNATLTVIVDSIRLQPDQYYLVDSLKLNFSPTLKSVTGYLNLHGDPHASVLDTTAANGWGINTISTSNWKPSLGGKSATDSGAVTSFANDMGGYFFDSTVTTSNFVNWENQFTGSNYSFQITGLNPSHLYRIEMLGSVTSNDNAVTGTVQRAGFSVQTKGSYNITKNSLCVDNTSYPVIFDTIVPNSSGDINIAIAGEDTSLGVNFANGWISAMRIYDMSKTTQTDDKVVLYKYRDSMTIHLPTGTYTSDALVFFLKEFNPSKTNYPLMIYLGGQGSAGGSLDVLRQEGAPAALTVGDEAYGINDSGDTIRYVLVAPHIGSTSNFGFDTASVESMLNYLKLNYTSILHIDTAQIYITGLSSGGISALNYTLAYPYRIRACYAIAAAGTVSAYDLKHGGQGLVDNDTYLMLWSHSDTYLPYMKTDYDTLRKYAAGHVLWGQWFYRPHTGFTLDYLSYNKRPLTGQSVCDFFADPTKEIQNNAWFTFSNAIVDSVYGGALVDGTPSSAVLSATESYSGITISTVATAKWGGIVNSNLDAASSTIGALYYGYLKHVIYSKNNGSYASDGDNLKITGLQANTAYDLLFYAAAKGYTGTFLTEYSANAGATTADLNILTAYNSVTGEGIPATLYNIVSDVSGEIDCAVWPKPASGTTSGNLISVIVRKH